MKFKTPMLPDYVFLDFDRQFEEGAPKLDVGRLTEEEALQICEQFKTAFMLHIKKRKEKINTGPIYR